MAEVATAPKVSMSKLIVAAFRASSLDAAAADIRAAVAKSNPGVEPTDQLINNVRHRLRHSKGSKKAAKAKGRPARANGRRRVRRTAPVVPALIVEGDPIARLQSVREFAVTVGGLDALTTMIGQIKSLQG